MATELRLGGVDELLAELERLAPDLAAEARPLQASSAEQTASNLRAAYPIDTGELGRSVEVVREGSSSEARVFTRVTVTAPHAGFFEFGTRYMPPTPTFTPIVRRGREEFLMTMIGRVKARGLHVRGGPANA